MVQISRRDLELLAIGYGVADFFSEGRLTKPVSKVTKAAIRKAAPVAARIVFRTAPKAALTAARLTPGPVAGAALGVAAIQNREKIADLAAQGYEIVAPAAQEFGQGVIDRAMDPEVLGARYEPTRPRDVFADTMMQRKRKRKKSKFNKAVSKGMSIVKSSTSYGKKGTINNAKKAFSMVTKVASGVKKGRKRPANGIRRKVANAIGRIL
tara:strand:- start:215 stop:844 length:630 start_codon:yes stop_codon:yes gene_type:complete